MKRYPKFLKTLPEFYGLSFYEIAALVVGLYIGMLLKLSSVYTLIVILACIGTLKAFRKTFDLKGFLLPSKKEIDLTQIRRGDK